MEYTRQSKGKSNTVLLTFTNYSLLLTVTGDEELGKSSMAGLE